ncbi:hypothetical protein CHS0354_042507, partial [Potamilus streckersoni]
MAEQGGIRNAEEEILGGNDSNIVAHDLLVRHTLECPSLTSQWLPDITILEGEDYTLHKLMLGTSMVFNQQSQHHLMIANIKLPNENRGNPLDNENESVKLKIEKKINHNGEVNKASYMPQNPCIIATNASTSDVLLFDYTRQPSRPNPDGKCNPDLILTGHQEEGYSLSWSPFLSGRLLSASDDRTICSWDINAIPFRRRFISPLNVYRAHTAIVNDVAWHHSHQSVFGSVGDDRRFIIWDTRSNQTQIVRAHTAEVQCLSFNPYCEYLMATGSADGSVAVWDIRYFNSRLYSIVAHQDATYQVHWSPHYEKVLASSGTDKMIYIWDLSKLEEKPSELQFIRCEHTGEIFEFSWHL